MENPVLGSILENLKAILLVTDETIAPFRNDRGNTSDSREFTVKEFIQRYLPSDFHIHERSPIYTKDAFSKNIDCVVLAPNHPLLTTPFRQVSLAEGVYAAVEIKPDISTLSDNSELMRGLNQIKSVKNLSRSNESNGIFNQLNKQTLPYFQKIPCVLFCFKSTDLSKTVRFIISQIKAGELKTDELPDMIVTLDNGIVFYTPHLRSNTIGPKIWSDLAGSAKTDEAFFHLMTKTQEQTLAVFLQIFLSFTPPTILTHSFIIKDYLQSAITLDQIAFIPLEWDYDYMDDLSAKSFIQLLRNESPESAIDEEAIRKIFKDMRRELNNKASNNND